MKKLIEKTFLDMKDIVNVDSEIMNIIKDSENQNIQNTYLKYDHSEVQHEIEVSDTY